MFRKEKITKIGKCKKNKRKRRERKSKTIIIRRSEKSIITLIEGKGNDRGRRKTDLEELMTVWR